MNLRVLASLWLWLASAFLFVGSASGGTVSFTSQSIDLQGSGFGNSLVSLVLHANDDEFGSVLRSGGSDLTTGDATNQSSTRTATELAGAGIDEENFSIVFNIAEPGSASDLLLFDFSLRFTDSTGVSLFADVTYDAPVAGLLLDQFGGGVGGAGWLFKINLTPVEALAFFAVGTNRVGMLIEESQAIQDSGGGPDSFFFAPEPNTLLLAVVGAIGLIARSRRSRITLALLIRKADFSRFPARSAKMVGRTSPCTRLANHERPSFLCSVAFRSANVRQLNAWRRALVN